MTSINPPGNLIKQELFQFNRLFHMATDCSAPVLLFPCGMNEVLMKGIRIIAAKYNMVSMYVQDVSMKSVVVFHTNNLKIEEQENWYKYFPETFNQIEIESIIDKIMLDRGLKSEEELNTGKCKEPPATTTPILRSSSSASLIECDNIATDYSDDNDDDNITVKLYADDNKNNEAFNNILRRLTQIAEENKHSSSDDEHGSNQNDKENTNRQNSEGQECIDDKEEQFEGVTEQQFTEENDENRQNQGCKIIGNDSIPSSNTQLLQVQNIAIEIDSWETTSPILKNSFTNVTGQQCKSSSQDYPFKKFTSGQANLTAADQGLEASQMIYKSVYELNVPSVQIKIYVKSDDAVQDLDKFSKIGLYDEIIQTTQAVHKTIITESDIKLLNVEKIYAFVKELYDTLDTESKLTEKQNHSKQSQVSVTPYKSFEDLCLERSCPDRISSLSYKHDNKEDEETGSQLKSQAFVSPNKVPIKCVLNTEKPNSNAFGSWETAITINDNFSMQIKDNLGPGAFVVLATENYLPYKNVNILNVIELYDVKMTSTEGILQLYKEFLPICKWLDETRAILVLPSDKDVSEALSIKDDFLKSRSIFDASSDAILAALTNIQVYDYMYLPVPRY